jgi:hypothetical protein
LQSPLQSQPAILSYTLSPLTCAFPACTQQCVIRVVTHSAPFRCAVRVCNRYRAARTLGEHRCELIRAITRARAFQRGEGTLITGSDFRCARGADQSLRITVRDDKRHSAGTACRTPDEGGRRLLIASCDCQLSGKETAASCDYRVAAQRGVPDVWVLFGSCRAGMQTLALPLMTRGRLQAFVSPSAFEWVIECAVSVWVGLVAPMCLRWAAAPPAAAPNAAGVIAGHLHSARHEHFVPTARCPDEAQLHC